MAQVPRPHPLREGARHGIALLASLVLWLGCDAKPAAEVETSPGDIAVTPWVGLDPEDGSPVLILDEREGSRRLPIWIGMGEARSIQAKLSSQAPPRPNTHDLVERLLEHVDGTIARVVVTELRDGIYYAEIVLQHAGRVTVIDARPSDATALAVRTGSPLFVREELLDQAGLEQAPRGREARHAAPAPDVQLHAERL
jgi:bifunctional DNase/RNase